VDAFLPMRRAEAAPGADGHHHTGRTAIIQDVFIDERVVKDDLGTS
jgi:hypothetical protein